MFNSYLKRFHLHIKSVILIHIWMNRFRTITAAIIRIVISVKARASCPFKNHNNSMILIDTFFLSPSDKYWVGKLGFSLYWMKWLYTITASGNSHVFCLYSVFQFFYIIHSVWHCFYCFGLLLFFPSFYCFYWSMCSQFGLILPYLSPMHVCM